MENQTDFDVVIVGAGPAGCGIASGLLHAGVTNIALIEKPVVAPFRIGESATPDVPRLLAELGLDFDEKSHRLYTGNLVCWGTDKAETHDFLFRGQGNGWHLNRAAFDEKLKAAVLERGVPIFSPDWISSLSPAEIHGAAVAGWEIKLYYGGLIRTKIVVDASGRNASFAKRLGIKRSNLDSLIALACRVPAADTLQGASFINTCEAGWWYAVHLADGHSLVSLMTDAETAKELHLHEPENFRSAWHSNHLLSSYIPAPPEKIRPHVFAAYTACLQKAAGKNWLAIGDALMSFDPLTSSGISGALSDAVAAVPVVTGLLQGNDAAARQFAVRANLTFKKYLAQRAAHYAGETRWDDSPFWSSRKLLKPAVSGHASVQHH